MRHVHVTSLGFTPQPILEPLTGRGLKCDKLYLLWNDNEKINDTLKKVREGISITNNEISVEPREIDPFSYNSVIKVVKDISIEEKKKEEKVQLYFNITPGTGLAVGALCASSYFTNARIYYYLDSTMISQPSQPRLIEIETPKIPDMERMAPMQKEIIAYLADGKPATNESLKEHLGKLHDRSKKKLGSLVSHHTGVLEKNGLIVRVKDENDRRGKILQATDLGIMLAVWLPKYGE